MTDAGPLAEGTRARRLAVVLGGPVLTLLALQLLGGLILSPSRTFLPVYLTELGHPALLVGLVVTVQQIMGLIASWVGGACSDALGRKPTLLLGQLGALASAASFWVASPTLIIGLRAIGGFGGGLHTVAAQSYLVDMAPEAHLGLLSAFFNWGYTLGGALSSPVAGYALDRWGYRQMGTGLVLGSLVAVGVTLWRLPTVRATRVGRSAEPLRGYGAVLRRPELRTLAMLRFLPTYYWGTATVLIPLLLLGAGATKMTVALYATVSQVVACLAQVAVGRAADRLSLRRTTLVVVGALVVAILGLGAVPGALWGVFAFGTASTAAAWSLSTLMPSLVSRVAKADERGRTLGWVHLWWNLGMVVGSMAGGALVSWRAGAPFWVAGALNLVTLGLAARFFRRGAG